MSDFLNEVIITIVRLVVAGCMTYVSAVIIPAVTPWLKKVGIYSIVKMCVNAAEKLAETGKINKEDKKAHCVTALKAMGIEVTPIIETMIEAAVEELDAQKGKVSDAFNE